jgi:hypothetical protein
MLNYKEEENIDNRPWRRKQSVVASSSHRVLVFRTNVVAVNPPRQLPVSGDAFRGRGKQQEIKMQEF